MNPFEKYLSEEDRLQRQVVDYVGQQYKAEVIPLNTESKKTPFEQFKWKWMGGKKGTVDLFIPVMRGPYGGLFLELKTEDRKVFKNDGSLYANGKETHQAQLNFMERMRESGYICAMVFGFDQAKTMIDVYFNIKQ